MMNIGMNTGSARFAAVTMPKFGVDLEGATDAEILAELAKRGKADDAKKSNVTNNVAKIINEIGSPVGTWRVTTQSDEEGKMPPRVLGTFTGHVADIAAALNKKSSYDLKFEPAEPLIYPVAGTQGNTTISLPVSTKTWDLKQTDRSDTINAWLATEIPARVTVKEVKSKGFSGVKIDFEA